MRTIEAELDRRQDVVTVFTNYKLFKWQKSYTLSGFDTVYVEGDAGEEEIVLRGKKVKPATIAFGLGSRDTQALARKVATYLNLPIKNRT